MIRLTKHITSLLAAGACLGLLGSCTAEDIDAPQPVQTVEPGTQLVINLAVPSGDGDAAPASRAGESTQRPDDDECAINSLRLLAFPESGAEGENRPLLIPSKMPVAPDGTAVYELRDFNPGKYYIYVVANIDGIASVKTKADLDKIMLDYSSRLPQAGNLPMIYEPSGVVEISKSAATTTPAILDLSMKFACVKVRYNIIFDKSIAATADVFGTAGLLLDAATADNVTKTSRLTLSTAAPAADNKRTITLSGTYYDTYTETPGNANVANADVISVTGAAHATPTAPATKWVYRGTLYLPERYATTEATQTTLRLTAHLTDASGKKGTVSTDYSLPLGGYDGDPASKQLPRGTYYEVIAKVKTLGNANLDAQIIAKDWESMTLPADFIHTYLSLNKTTAEVESLKDDAIEWQTDGRGTPQFVCTTTYPVLNGTPFIDFVPDYQNKRVNIRVNANIDVIELGKIDNGNLLKGEADCYIQAGNIRKHFTVKYDISPFFIIEPLAVKIQFSASDKTQNVKLYEYRTNLGGIKITTLGSPNDVLLDNNTRKFTSTIRDKSITVECATPNAAVGTLTVTAINDPGTTMVHYFGAYPAKFSELTAQMKAQMDNGGKEDIQVTVMPPLGDYRIYFRAINDWHLYDGGETATSGEWLQGQSSMNDSYYPVEYRGTAEQNNNWIDYWYCASYNGDSAWGNAASNNRYPHESSHRVYIWTQEGETYTNDDNPKVWRFTDDYIPSENMTQDYANPGWYYYNLPQDRKQKYHMGGASGDRIPEPGTTLMIFNNHTNAKNPGYSVHRATHHLDPGIPLFDYEDREGWVIYDPTSEPYYRIYDEKPYIEDVTYTIHSNKKITGWYKKYGVAEKNASINQEVAQFTIYSNNTSSNTQSGSMWTYKLRLKAPHGDYEKAIRIKFDGVTNPGSTQTTTHTVTKQRVYFFSTSRSANPTAYIYIGANDDNHAWPGVDMTYEKAADGGYYWYADVDDRFLSGWAIFTWNNQGSRDPQDGQQGFAINSRSNIYRSNLSSDKWQAYPAGEQTTTETVTTTIPGEDGFIMFDGRAYPGNTGYFNATTRKWSSSKNF